VDRFDYPQVEKLFGEEMTKPARESFLAGAKDDSTPDEIEGYTLIRPVGKGGMGVVYLAEQHHPVQRTVAIKLIKLGMDTHEMVSRFHAERQALARMGHPSIANVYDAGASEDGRPYFVMEFVDGVPLATYCDEHRLSTRQRLELFVQICEGIQHAHQKGIIHRDIKPSNILVTEQDDGTPLPKIIDFGIAKATDAKATMLTEVGQVIGTLAYMSPEQASMTGSHIDTRTDVYSLGLVLYKLLIGTLPFESMEDQAFTDILRAIREVEPLRPSTRLQRMDDTSAQVAALRRTDTRSLAGALRGDLDWIVMKALEKEKDRRYASASELAADVGRYLANQPVVARPISRVYWTRKFIKRHKVGVAAIAAVFVALVIGIVGTTFQMVRAKAAERRAEEETKTSESALDYIVQVFELANPEQSTGEPITLRDMLDEKSPRVQNVLPDQPGARGRVMLAMAKAYSGLSAYTKANSLLEQALPLLRLSYGEQSRHVFSALNQLGILYNKRQDYQRAIEVFEQMLAIEVALHGEESLDGLNIRKNIADAYRLSGRPDDARKMLEFVLEVRRRLLGPNSMKVARTLSSMAGTMAKSGEYEAAISYAEQSLEIRLNQSEPKPASVGFGYFTLGDVQLQSSSYEEALDSFSKMLSAWERIYDADDDNISIAFSCLAETHMKLGNGEQSYAFYQRARAIDEKNLDPEDPDDVRSLVKTLDENAELLDGLGRPAEAEKARNRAAELREQHGLSGPGESSGQSDSATADGGGNPTPTTR